jgi:energy-coupling factor transporter ATP-binding protein EcfA2
MMDGRLPPLTEPQQAALAKVGCGIEAAAGLALLCGPSGVGKSTVLAHLADAVRQQGKSLGVQSVADWLGSEARLTDVVAADDAHLATEADLAALMDRCRSRRPGAVLVLAGEGRLLTLVGRNSGLARAVRIQAALLPGSLADTRALLTIGTPSAIATEADDPATAAIHEIAAGVPADVLRLAEWAGVVASSRPDGRVTAADVEAIHRRLSPQAA